MSHIAGWESEEHACHASLETCRVLVAGVHDNLPEGMLHSSVAGPHRY